VSESPLDRSEKLSLTKGEVAYLQAVLSSFQQSSKKYKALAKQLAEAAQRLLNCSRCFECIHYGREESCNECQPGEFEAVEDLHVALAAAREAKVLP
jgi:recombinational DNA repair protein RecR